MPTNTLPEATVWGQNADQRDGFEHRVPSGQLCRLRTMDLQTMVLEGIIEDVDAVSRIVTSDIMKKRNRRSTQTDVQKIVEGLTFMKSDDGRTMIQLVNDIIPHVVIAPEVLPLPQEGEKRVKGKIYVDDIDINDRADIFATVMKGVEKTAQFRE